MNRRTWGVLLGLACLTTGVAPAADWPLFRGDGLQTGYTKEALPATLQVLWKFSTKDAIEGGAAIVGDTVYIGSADEHLYALALADGIEKWKYKTKGPVKATPGVRNGLVYLGDGEGTFHCVDAATGQARWTFRTEGEIIPSANFDGDRVIFGSADEFLYCLHARSGAEFWRFKVPGGPINPSPPIVEGRCFATGCDSTLHIISTTDGKEIASVELGAQIGASPAVAGELLFVGDMDRTVRGIDWKQAKVIWEYRHPDKEFPFYSSAAVVDDLVVVGGRDKLIHALSARSGEMKWTFSTRGKIDGSPVIAGDRVYVGSGDGSLYVLDLRQGNKLAEHPLGAPVSGSPAVAQKRLVLGTQDGIVFCFGAK
jgi:outer membrane protein assembly factor BamB